MLSEIAIYGKLNFLLYKDSMKLQETHRLYDPAYFFLGGILDNGIVSFLCAKIPVVAVYCFFFACRSSGVMVTS